MCKAWNHPPGCKCGWGGEDDVRGSRFYRAVRCPHCDRPVFQVLQRGAEIWVENESWPWTRHPCFEQAPQHGRLLAYHRFVPDGVPGLVVDCLPQTETTGRIVLETAHRRTVHADVSGPVDPSRLVGELVLISAGSRQLYHPLLMSAEVVPVAPAAEMRHRDRRRRDRRRKAA